MPTEAVKKLTPRHEQIIQFLIANPEMRKQDVARAFGVTPAWLSQLMSSHAFQHQLRQRQDEVFESCVLHDLSERMTAVAHLALDKMEQRLETADDFETAYKSAELTLKNLGYGAARAAGGVPPGVAVQQNNFYTADPAQIAAAREKLQSQSNVVSLPEPSSGDE